MGSKDEGLIERERSSVPSNTLAPESEIDGVGDWDVVGVPLRVCVCEGVSDCEFVCVCVCEGVWVWLADWDCVGLCVELGVWVCEADCVWVNEGDCDCVWLAL